MHNKINYMDDIKILVVTAGWNCEQYVKRCFDSIKNQTYQNFNVVAIDDYSLDDTFVEICLNMNDKFKPLHSNQNFGGYISYDAAIEYGKKHFNFDIIVFVGLDDFIYPTALEKIVAEYKANPELLHTYSAYVNNDGFIYKDLFYSEEIIKNRDYRKDKYRCTGCVSIRKELYFSLPFIEQCEIEKNIYYNVETSMSFLEMAGDARIKVIEEPIYHYNNSRLDNTANRFGRDLEVYKQIMNRPKRELF